MNMMYTNEKHLFNHVVQIQLAKIHHGKWGYDLSKETNFPVLSDLSYICSYSSWHIYVVSPSTHIGNYSERQLLGL